MEQPSIRCHDKTPQAIWWVPIQAKEQGTQDERPLSDIAPHTKELMNDPQTKERVNGPQTQPPSPCRSVGESTAQNHSDDLEQGKPGVLAAGSTNAVIE